MFRKLAQKNKFHHESDLKLYSFPWGNLQEAVLLRGTSDWRPNMIYSPIFATTLLFSHSRSSLLQSHSLLFPVLGYVLFPMLLDTIKSNHSVLNRPPPICRYCSVKRQPGPELTSFMVTCYHNTIQIELRVFPRPNLLMVS